MKNTMQYIHLDWSGPHTYEQAKELKSKYTDFGVYQIYGAHPLYGIDVLLYIGKAQDQPFGVRLAQENWGKDYFNADTQNVKVYVGRPAGADTPDDERWSEEIELAEKLLIYAHTPACNSSNLNSIPFDRCQSIHVLNWGKHRDLLPEVSGARYAKDAFPEFEKNYEVYGESLRREAVESE